LSNQREASSNPQSGFPAEPLAFLIFDSVGRVTHANAHVRQCCHRDPDTLTGESFDSVFSLPQTSTGDDSTNAWSFFLELISKSEPTVVSLRPSVTSDAQVNLTPVRVRAEPLSGGAWLVQLQRDSASADATSVAASSVEALVQHGALGFFELDVAAGRATCTASWKKILGYVDAELPDTIEAWRGLIHPEDSAAAPDHVRKNADEGSRPFNVEFRMRHRTGRWVWVQSIGIQQFSSDGDLLRVVGLDLDISDRKEMEEASVTNDERLNLLANGSLALFDLHFAERNYWFSPGWKSLLRFRAGESSQGLEAFERALPADEKAAGVPTWIQLRSPGQPTVLNPETLVAQDGELVPVLMGMHRTYNRRRELVRVVGFAIATPLDGRAIPAVPLLDTALDAIAEGVLITDASGKIMHLNPAGRTLLGINNEALEQPTTEILQWIERDSGAPAEDPFRRALVEDDSSPVFTHCALPAREGQPPRPIAWTARVCRDSHGRPHNVVIVFRDTADVRHTPEELIKANRIESLSVAASGIAHQFNDLLTTIVAGISLNKDRREPLALEESEKACRAAKGLTEQLARIAKGGSEPAVVISAEELLAEPIKLATAGSDVEITCEVAEETDVVRVDRGQMTHAFQNLILNALQAMSPPPHRARIHIRVANVVLNADQIPPLAAGNYLGFEVRDNGSGISPADQERIFEPYFTTRKHRTGLGLSTALSIVRKHGGQIAVASVPGEGTAFTVYLPGVEAPKPPEIRKAPTQRFRTGRILFMDDDPKVSAMTAAMLETLEYSFDLARNGAEAVQLYQRYFNIGRPYDVVILDVTVVGGMGGEECYKALRDVDPEVRAIISTGLENELMARRYLDLGFCGCLSKPYRAADLGRTLKAVLG
jgi:two-component system cell cycle sensor histidine kinase/response regulator CckA